MALPDAVKDNRARRRREVARQMRDIIERAAALGSSTDESNPQGRAQACKLCESLFECDPGCLAGDARAFLARHVQQAEQ